MIAVKKEPNTGQGKGPLILYFLCHDIILYQSYLKRVNNCDLQQFNYQVVKTSSDTKTMCRHHQFCSFLLSYKNKNIFHVHKRTHFPRFMLKFLHISLLSKVQLCVKTAELLHAFTHVRAENINKHEIMEVILI